MKKKRSARAHKCDYHHVNSFVHCDTHGLGPKDTDILHTFTHLFSIYLSFSNTQTIIALSYIHDAVVHSKSVCIGSRPKVWLWSDDESGFIFLRLLFDNYFITLRQACWFFHSHSLTHTQLLFQNCIRSQCCVLFT